MSNQSKQLYQERVIEEKNQLDEKLNKLRIFFYSDVFKGLDPEEQARLRFQELIMKSYSEILHQRIEAFQKG